MDLAELNRVANAMVAPGRGILAADKSSGTIKKRFDAIGVECTEDNRRDYRELLFRSKGMSNISGVILYDETIRQKAKDGTPLVKVIEAAGTLPGIKVDKGAHPLPFCPGEMVTEGLDGLRERLAEYRGLGAKFAKWRAVINIGPGIPSYACVNANAHALARYAALCQDEGIVPIVEPEVIMDGDHDIDRCAEVSEFALKTLYEQLYYARVKLEGTVLKPNMVVPGKTSPKQASVRRGRREDHPRIEGMRAGRGAGHRLSLRRPIRSRRHGAARRHEQTRRVAVEAQLLLQPRASGRAAEGVGGKGREHPSRATGIQPPRRDEFACLARRVEARAG